MKGIKSFLESSTIHGLAHISTPRKFVRLFWIIVVIAGFTGAGYMIYTSFQSWEESPVKTTIETLSIKELEFPKVTVCPPKNTFTNLNYGLKMTKNMSLDNDTRKELTNNAVRHLHQHLYAVAMKNLSMVEDDDRYHNWYHGYTQVRLPSTEEDYGLYHRIDTAATSGTIFTKDFGNKYKANKVLTSCMMTVVLFPPESLQNNRNVTLHFEYENIPLKDLMTGSERFDADYVDILDEYTQKNYTPPLPSPATDRYYYRLVRNVKVEDIESQELDTMPGFKITWYYSGMEVDPMAKYSNAEITKAFVRKGYIIIIIWSLGQGQEQGLT